MERPARSCPVAMQATGNPAWAALSTSGLRSLDLPKDFRDVIVLADGDEAGEAAARDCTLRCKREGRRVRIARPPQGWTSTTCCSAQRPATRRARNVSRRSHPTGRLSRGMERREALERRGNDWPTDSAPSCGREGLTLWSGMSPKGGYCSLMGQGRGSSSLSTLSGACVLCVLVRHLMG